MLLLEAAVAAAWVVVLAVAAASRALLFLASGLGLVSADFVPLSMVAPAEALPSLPCIARVVCEGPHAAALPLATRDLRPAQPSCWRSNPVQPSSARTKPSVRSIQRPSYFSTLESKAIAPLPLDRCTVRGTVTQQECTSRTDGQHGAKAAALVGGRVASNWPAVRARQDGEKCAFEGTAGRRCCGLGGKQQRRRTEGRRRAVATVAATGGSVAMVLLDGE